MQEGQVCWEGWNGLGRDAELEFRHTQLVCTPRKCRRPLERRVCRLGERINQEVNHQSTQVEAMIDECSEGGCEKVEME